MGAMDYFGRAYVVNLAARTDRRREMERELGWAGLAPAPGKVEFFAAVRPEAAAPFATIGERGCFLSHYHILRDARDASLSSVLLMEDDLAISPKFREQQGAVVEQLRSTEWDIAYLGHVEPVPDAATIAFRPVTTYLMTTHFYAVNGRVFDRLIEFLELVQSRPAGHPDGGPMPLDGALWTFRQQNPDVVTVIAEPNLGWQRSSRSDIAPAKWFDRVPLLASAVSLARRGKVWLESRRKA